MVKLTKEEKYLNEKITVCDKCLRACCWQGIFLCEDSRYAGTIEKTRRELIKLKLEHTDYMTNGE